MTAQAISQAKQQLKSILTYLSPEQIHQVMEASDFADFAHTGVTRKSGEPYILHPIAVAMILANLRLDDQTLIAALLHDVIEDTDISKEEIIERFGLTVAQLVDGVTKLTSSGDKHFNKVSSFRKFLRSVLNDPRVVVVKLADRYHNMSTLGALRLDKRQRIAQETADVYVPMARLLGMNEMADLLENLCYENLDPDLYQTATEALAEHEAERIEYQGIWQVRLQDALNTLGIWGEIETKDNTTDLLRLFFKNQISLHRLSHSHACHVSVHSVQDCENMVETLRKRFTILNYENYIRNPLPGGKQAIILELQGPKTFLSLIIQTELMYKTERFGVLLGDNITQVSRSAIQASLHNLSNLIDDDCAKTTFDDLLNYLHRDKYTFYTPKGDMHELPRGASALDFAYAASTELGNMAVACKIDGKEMPICTILENRQTVEILIKQGAKPNPEWLSCIATPKARRGILSQLRVQTFAEKVDIGRQALNRALGFFSSSLDELNEQHWRDLLAWRKLSNQDELFAQIATGDLLPQLVANKLFNHSSNQSISPIAGTEGVDIKYAPCCHPVKGDVIVGHSTKRGLVIHRFKCRNVQQEQKLHPQTVVPLHWQDDIAQDMRFNAYLKIDTLLDDELTSKAIYVVRSAEAGVNAVQTDHDSSYLSIVVRDRNHVAQVMRDLRILLDFPKIKRLYELPAWFKTATN
ncbi:MULTISPECIES: RelA/SpoT family protein [unclassified Acinetobacter]|uniref:RelA/SpoT family protein n=1 Tax=unclassified Acinetobacter TaxID=196816 RepID=UPI0035B6D2D0